MCQKSLSSFVHSLSRLLWLSVHQANFPSGNTFYFLKAVLDQGFTWAVVCLFSLLGNGLNYHALITYFPSAHTESRKTKAVPVKTGSTLQTTEGYFGKKKKKKVWKNASSQTFWTSSCFLLLLFPWQLVGVDFTKSPSNPQRHRWGLLRLLSFTGQTRSRENIWLL